MGDFHTFKKMKIAININYTFNIIMSETIYLQKDVKRLYSRTRSVINPNYEKPCLEFTGATNKDNYGIFWYNGKNEYAHRISYAMANNIKISDLITLNEKNEIMQVCHGKDCSRLCIEPTHLEYKDIVKNMFDDKHRDNKIRRGEKNGSAIITEELAAKIKLSKGEMTISERAIKYNVSRSIVVNIDYNNSWAHLPNKDGIITSTLESKNRKNNRKKELKKIDLTEIEYDSALKYLRDKCVISDTISPTVETPCWVYKGSILHGYGRTEYLGRTFRTHILAYEAFTKLKNKDKTLMVLHKCNNKICCNPEHLKLGPNSENSIDARNNKKKNVILNIQKVKEIKKLIANGIHIKDISITYGTSLSTIADIKHKRKWKDVEI